MTIPALVRWYDYVKTKDRAVLWDALHPDAVFESPVVHTPQYGREITFKYLSVGRAFPLSASGGAKPARSSNSKARSTASGSTAST